MNDKKLVDLRKNFYVDTVAISGDYIRITTDNATTVINLKDKAFADIKEININGAKFYKLPEDSVAITREELKKIIQEEYQNALKDKVVITKKEYERLLKIEKDFNTVHYCFVEKSRVVEASKKTARELLIKQYQECIRTEKMVLKTHKNKDYLYYDGFLTAITNLKMYIIELAKQYGVEVE